MLTKTLASVTAAIMTLSLFTGTVSVMNFAASGEAAWEVQA